ncbi:hypothetical protein K474DRAFT_1665037 [Panus rudis PR-1116 ss-1]|nr:hypothetical protein K474DRAFT_1665037 [Panus rudis PR-1116 ss-1]
MRPSTLLSLALALAASPIAFAVPLTGQVEGDQVDVVDTNYAPSLAARGTLLDARDIYDDSDFEDYELTRRDEFDEEDSYHDETGLFRRSSGQEGGRNFQLPSGGHGLSFSPFAAQQYDPNNINHIPVHKDRGPAPKSASVPALDRQGFVTTSRHPIVPPGSYTGQEPIGSGRPPPGSSSSKQKQSSSQTLGSSRSRMGPQGQPAMYSSDPKASRGTTANAGSYAQAAKPRPPPQAFPALPVQPQAQPKRQGATTKGGVQNPGYAQAAAPPQGKKQASSSRKTGGWS